MKLPRKITLNRFFSQQIADIVGFSEFLWFYSKKRIMITSTFFEKYKNKLVKVFLMKRGRYNRPFLHLSTMTVLGIGVLIAPYLADTYPVFAAKNESILDLTAPEAQQQSIIVGENVFQTEISDKPRDEIIIYMVQKGDTISTVARKFGVSEDTVKWANDLTSDNLSIGDELKILPVTGIAHKVSPGDTIYTIAKKYDTDAQGIVNYPFNDFANPETFSLVSGQMVIVPEGIKPSEQPTVPRRPRYIAQQGSGKVSSAGFSWPLPGGGISTYPVWYHMAVDITSPLGVAVYAGQTGTVIKASSGTWDGGYGTNIMIDDGAGTQTLYAHLLSLNVSVGDSVVAGKTIIGLNGSTGRSTGPHVHFEIRKNGVLVNPISYL